jgi:hypothetical protein
MVGQNENEYREQRISKRLTVDWGSAVIRYASKIATYGFMTGVGVGLLATIGANYPQNGQEWVQAGVMTLASGLILSGAFAGASVVFKDALFPYTRPSETIRSIPAMGAPGNMKPQPLMNRDGHRYVYGKVKLSPEGYLSLAEAVLVRGENMISLRKLAEWRVIASRDSAEAKQLKQDFIRTRLGIDAGNGMLHVTDDLREFLIGMFPALTPLPQPGI